MPAERTIGNSLCSAMECVDASAAGTAPQGLPFPPEQSSPEIFDMSDTTPTPASSTPPPEGAEDPRKDSLIEYPSLFPIKVMGEHNEHLVREITRIAKQFDPGFDASTVELRPSSAGKYLGVTVTVTATSREQLDDLYRAFTSHPMVKVVL
jgi:putative lipoic acid-binding regulatory protein